VPAGTKKKTNVVRHAKCWHGLVTKSVTIVTTTVDATGMVVTVAGSKTITATVTPVLARMRNTFTIPNAKKIAQYMHGRAMGIVTTTTMSAAVAGTAGIAVGIVVKHTSILLQKV